MVIRTLGWSCVNFVMIFCIAGIWFLSQSAKVRSAVARCERALATDAGSMTNAHRTRDQKMRWKRMALTPFSPVWWQHTKVLGHGLGVQRSTSHRVDCCSAGLAL